MEKEKGIRWRMGKDDEKQNKKKAKRENI